MLSINTNLSSMIAQNSKKTSTAKLAQAIERMTTGAKLNHAKDNAANYSIATNITTKMGALRVAEDNALQGLEMISSTSENLSIVEDKLARMRALSTQALSGTYSSQSLNAVNLEADALLKEINRINESATYNGIKLFNTGKAEVTNAGKELKLNEQGFLQDVVKVDTTGMTPLGSMADDATLAVGEYTISDVNELVQLTKMANSGLITAGSTFVLNADIDIEAYCKSNLDANGIGGWEPIKLAGSNFEGNGHTIKGLYINRNSSNQALFYSAKNIKNLKLLNCDIKGKKNIAGISAQGATIKNCSVSGNISSTDGNVGGILGYSYYGGASYCYVNATIKTDGSNAGGIIGNSNYATVSKSVTEGSILGTGNVGGIQGYGDDVNTCKSSMFVKGDTNVGGISGGQNRSFPSNYFNGTVQGNNNVGGISGFVTTGHTISDALMEGNVIGKTNVGLLLGKGGSATSHVINSSYYIGKSNTQNILGDPNNVIFENITDITVPCNYTFQIGTSEDDATSRVAYTTYIDFTPLKELLTSGVDSAQCLAKIDELVEIVSLKQTELGTMENRLMSVLDEISTQYENLASSRSTIRDVDMTKVGSVYIKQQILQDASATLLSSTHNIQYQNVLGLLQSLSG